MPRRPTHHLFPVTPPAAVPPAFDEMLGFAAPVPPPIAASTLDAHLAQTELTADWRAMWDALSAQSRFLPAHLDQRWQDLQRRVRDDEVSYNVYTAPTLQREWDMELLPVLIGPGAWQQLERGLLQRVRVLNALLADLYGDRKLLRSGLLPPALVQGHPDYLQCMYRVLPPHGTFLHVAAFDVVHGPDGQWHVLSQRLQAPSGLGYLLGNRQASLQQLPQAFDSLHVRRLSDTYRVLVDGLRAHCAEGADARIALLTPGPYNETYFEHAYLARRLGITLVEGADLTVRDQRLFLKTIHGLSPVHALIKRLDDQYLDPLELRPDSQLGVPGLLQAMRAGNVLVANWPGTGFMESSAILGFLPALAEHLLGEQLVLPAAPTWWCGEAAVRAQALAMLDDCVIKPTYPPPYPGTAAREYFDPVLTRWLSPQARADWAARIVAHGDDYTVQAHVPGSHQPVWRQGEGGGALATRPVVVRLFAVSSGPGEWQVLPGGMARLPQDTQSLSTMRLGGTSADVWVLRGAAANGPAAQPARISPPVQPTGMPLTEPDVARRTRAITSRVAENLFWMGRYTERADNLARLALLVLDTQHSDSQTSVPLMDWLTRSCLALELVDDSSPQGPGDLAAALHASLPPGSAVANVGNTLAALRNAASKVRHHMGRDHWRAIRSIERDFAQACEAGGDLRWALQQVRERMVGIVGAQLDHMTRDDGWRILTLGRHTERLGFFSQVLAQAFYANAVHDVDGHEAVLTLFDSNISFHALYQQSLNTASLLDLLVLSTENPRSLAYVTTSMRKVLAQLRRQAPENAADLAQDIPQAANASLALLCAADEHGHHAQLQTLLRNCDEAAQRLTEQINQRHFTHYHEARRALWV